MTILQIAQDAADELGMDRPASLFGQYDEGDTSPRKMLRAMTRTLRDLNTQMDWQNQRRQALVYWPVNNEVTTTTQWKAPDFLRFVPQTMHNRSAAYRLHGPVTAAEWQDIKLGYQMWWQGAFRLASDQLMITPAPGLGAQIVYEYISNGIFVGADGTSKAVATADTDVSAWGADDQDELVLRGTIMNVRKMERFDYAADEKDFMRITRDRYKMDGHSAIIDMSGESDAMGSGLLPYGYGAPSVIINQSLVDGYAVPVQGIAPRDGWSVR